MKMWNLRFWTIKFSTLVCLLASSPTVAQVVPDTTLPVNSSVTTQGNTSIINGGTRAGSNLFHSFDAFSVRTGSAAYFNNALDIQNIISRVTGGSISNIDGLIRANGTANLFLLNPNGIIFGPNASLNIGGSFLATTASSLNFGNGTSFSATAQQTTPLLTTSVPIGLQFGRNPGAISVVGSGYKETNDLEPTFSPFPKVITEGLKVHPGRSLALVAGDVNLVGGTLAAESGRIELGSVDNGVVSLSPTSSGWTLGYENVQNLRDIQLSQRALIDTSGGRGGDIQLFGRRVTLTDGSLALVQNQGFQHGGSINVRASEYLEEIGTSPNAKVPSGLFNETVGNGDAGNIAILTRRLSIQDGAKIVTRTFSTGAGGNINVNAFNSVALTGFSSVNPNIVSIINATSYRSGEAGNVTVTTGQLTASKGGGVSSIAFGTGTGGDVTVNATDFIELIGVNPINLAPSVLGTSTYRTGSAGNLKINTSKLAVRNGGRVDASTFAAGNAGNVTVNASDSVEVSSSVSSDGTLSLVDSSATIPPKIIQQLLKLPLNPSGNSGDVTIETGQLKVTNGGLVDVRNDGSGKAGNLRVNARDIFLDNKSGITAATISGEVGSIFLGSNNLQLRRGSTITTTAGGSGNGGNITINASTLTALENSDITANAINGKGGNIRISAQGIFRSLNSNITASSKLGINGTVRINTLDTNPNPAISNPVGIPQTPLVASACQRGSGVAASQFIITGTGGIPPSPSDLQYSHRGWEDDSLPIQATQNSKESELSTSSEPRQIVAAQGWRRNSDGTVTLIAEPDEATPYSSASLPPCTQASASQVTPIAQKRSQGR